MFEDVAIDFQNKERKKCINTRRLLAAVLRVNYYRCTDIRDNTDLKRLKSVFLSPVLPNSTFPQLIISEQTFLTKPNLLQCLAATNNLDHAPVK